MSGEAGFVTSLLLLMATVSLDEESDIPASEDELTLEEMLDSARELMTEGSTEDAVLVFGHALQTAIEQQGNEIAPDCGPFYFAYGDALLAAEDNSARDLEDIMSRPRNQEISDAPVSIRPHSPGGRERPDDDVELAWEMLEGARLCFNKLQPGIHKNTRLADTHSRIGDVHGANEMFGHAVEEYKTALALRQEALAQALQEYSGSNAKNGEHCDPSAGSASHQQSLQEVSSAPFKIAAEFCNIGRALQWSVPAQTEAAIEHYNRARAVLQKELHTQTNSNSTPDPTRNSIEEITKHIQDITAKINELCQCGRAAPVAGETTAVGTKRGSADLSQRLISRVPAPIERADSLGHSLLRSDDMVRLYCRQLGVNQRTRFIRISNPVLTIALLPRKATNKINTDDVRWTITQWGGLVRNVAQTESTTCTLDWEWGPIYAIGKHESDANQALDSMYDGCDTDCTTNSKAFVDIQNTGNTILDQLIIEVLTKPHGFDTQQVFSWPTQASWFNGNYTETGGTLLDVAYANQICRLCTHHELPAEAEICGTFDRPLLLFNMAPNDGDTANAAQLECWLGDAGNEDGSHRVNLAQVDTVVETVDHEQLSKCAILFDYALGSLRLKNVGTTSVAIGLLELRQ